MRGIFFSLQNIVADINYPASHNPRHRMIDLTYPHLAMHTPLRCADMSHWMKILCRSLVTHISCSFGRFLQYQHVSNKPMPFRFDWAWKIWKGNDSSFEKIGLHYNNLKDPFPPLVPFPRTRTQDRRSISEA